MQIQIFKDDKAIGKVASGIFTSLVVKKPNAVLGLATGSSPLLTYTQIIKSYKDNLVDFSAVTTFNLDEYIGLPPSHHCSYACFMKENLFDAINLDMHQYFLPSGTAENLEDECRKYESLIDSCGGIDLQILGLGHNGHIAFNEPDDHFPARTHVVNLTESTIDANKRFFDSAEDVPKKAITTGIGTIFKAKNIVLIATGKSKAEAVHAMVNGPISPLCPASILQLHNSVTILLDPDAASRL